jgi:hypothetical protein
MAYNRAIVMIGLNSTCQTMNCIYNLIDPMNMTLTQVAAIPEQDAWRYEGNYSMVCDVFVCEVCGATIVALCSACNSLNNLCRCTRTPESLATSPTVSNAPSTRQRTRTSGPSTMPIGDDRKLVSSAILSCRIASCLANVCTTCWLQCCMLLALSLTATNCNRCVDSSWIQLDPSVCQHEQCLSQLATGLLPYTELLNTQPHPH